MSKRAKVVKRDRRAEALAFDVAVGARIRARRQANGALTQIGLGDLIGFSGTQVSRYEMGEATCEPHTLALIAKALKCKASDFLDGIELRP